MSTREVYHVAFSNGWRNAHWAIFIPSPDAVPLPVLLSTSDTATAKFSVTDSTTTSIPSTGHIIHVVGNKATGFTLEFKRNYSFLDEDRRFVITSLGSVSAKFIRERSYDKGKRVVSDATPTDRMEMYATMIEAPGPAKDPWSPEAKACQWWIGEYVEELIRKEVLGEKAREKLGRAPKKIC
jgi:hypothetical protein